MNEKEYLRQGNIWFTDLVNSNRSVFRANFRLPSALFKHGVLPLRRGGVWPPSPLPPPSLESNATRPCPTMEPTQECYGDRPDS